MPKNNHIEEVLDTPSLDEIKVFNSKDGFEVYISDVKFEIEYYQPLMNILHNESGKITFYINSNGGSLDTFIMLKNAILYTEMETKAVIQSIAHSAGSMLALCCDELEVRPHSYMLIHNYSGGFAGKASDIETQFAHNNEHFKSLFRDIYQYFLTEDEINLTLQGVEKWLSAEEIEQRWEQRQEMYQLEFEEQQNEFEQEQEANLVAMLMERGYKIEKDNG